MAIALIQQKSTGFSYTPTAASRTFTWNAAPAVGSRLIAVVVYAGGASIPVLTQTGVTWTLRHTLVPAAGPHYWIFTSDHLATVPSTTVTITRSGGNISTALIIHAFEFVGVTTSANPLTGTAVTAGNGAATSIAPGNLTPGAANAFRLAVHTHESFVTQTVTAGPTDSFTAMSNVTALYGVGTYKSYLSARTQSVAAALNPSITISGSNVAINACQLAIAPNPSYAPTITTPDPPLNSNPPPAPWEAPLTEKDSATITLETVSHLLRQFREEGSGQTIQDLTSAMAESGAALETAAFDILELLDPDAASGVHLDRLGKLVGQEREGRNDANYRIAIKARIAVNRSSGTLPELLNIVRILVGDDAFIRAAGYAKQGFDSGAYWIHADNVAVPEEVAAMLGDADLAGVGGVLTYTSDLAGSLRLSDTTAVGPIANGLSAVGGPGGGLAGLWQVPTE